MSIIQLQRRIMEAGRIRIGQQVPTGNGKSRPAKLDTFRITSADRARIDAIARLYGGTPREWDAPAGRQWEVVTETDALPIIVPPSDMAFSQHYELWSAGGCQRRCDGATESIGDQPCVCDPEARECDIHTRLSVMLRDVPGLGVYRLDTQGYYAAVELQGAIEVVQMAAARGAMIPARLRLEQRQTKRPGQGTRKFAVPVVDLEISPAQLLGGQTGGMALPPADAPSGVAAIASGPHEPDDEPPALLTPVPETVRERPAASVADQVADAQGQGGGVRRAGSAAPVPGTGLAPRTVAQAEAGETNRQGAPESVAPQAGDDLEAMTVAKLKLRCKRADLPVSGTKAELIERLRSGPGESRDEPQAPDPVEDRGTPPQDPPPPDDEHDQAPGTDPNGPVTEGQRKKLFAVLREHGITDEQRKAVLKAKYDRDSLNDLTSTQVAWIIDRLEGDGGPDAFKAVADEWLAAQQPPEDTDGDTDSEVEVEGADDKASLAERARAHAEGRSDVIAVHQERIRAAFAVLAVANPPIYEAGWARLQKITDGRAATSDWSGASERQLSGLTEDMERAAREVEDA